MKKGVVILLVFVVLVLVIASLFQFNFVDLSLGSGEGASENNANSGESDSGSSQGIFSIKNNDAVGGSGSVGGSVENSGGVDYAGRGAFLSDSNLSDQNNGNRTVCSELMASGNCVSQYTSACGWYDPEFLKCSEGLCVKRFTGECEACSEPGISYWSEGECPYH